MAHAHIDFGNGTSQTVYGGQVRNVLSSLRTVKTGLPELISVLSSMIEGGDATQVANFATMRVALNCPTDAEAKALFDELSSLNFKLGTNASQIDVATAISQVLAKLG
jgi:hypothetical protein